MAVRFFRDSLYFKMLRVRLSFYQMIEVNTNKLTGTRKFIEILKIT